MIKITTDKNEYDVGETVRGNISITPDKDYKLNSLVIGLDYSTEGVGDRDSGSLDTNYLDIKTLTKGELISKDFELKIPDDSLISYEGDTLSILIKVSVYIDIPWARDKSIEKIIWVYSHSHENV